MAVKDRDSTPSNIDWDDELTYQPSVWLFLLLMLFLVFLAAFVVFWALPQLDMLINPPDPPALQPPLRI